MKDTLLRKPIFGLRRRRRKKGKNKLNGLRVKHFQMLVLLLARKMGEGN